MNLTAHRQWSSAAIRGSFAILFGIGAFLLPNLTLALLVLLYGVFALVDGLAALAFAIGDREHLLPTWALFLEAVLGISAGAIALMWPGLTLFAVVYIVAFWAVARGILEIIEAIRFHKLMEHEWFLAATGLASVLLGAMMAASPDIGIMVMSYLLGCYAVVYGISLIAFAIHVHHGSHAPKLPHW